MKQAARLVIGILAFALTVPTHAFANSMIDPTGAIYGGANLIFTLVSGFVVLVVAATAVLTLRWVEREVSRRVQNLEGQAKGFTDAA